METFFFSYMFLIKILKRNFKAFATISAPVEFFLTSYIWKSSKYKYSYFPNLISWKLHHKLRKSI